MEANYGFKPEFLPSSEYNDNNVIYPNPVSPSYNKSFIMNHLPYPTINNSSSSLSPSNFYPNSYMNGQNKAFRWVDTYSFGGVPSTALPGGVDVDGDPIYVGKAFYEGNTLPAKVIPNKNVAYIAYNGEEHAVDQYQVLCETRFQWIPTYGGNIPPNAVEGGRTQEGEPLYIGRAHHEGSQTVGKVHGSHGCCYIPFDGREISYNNYEVLVLQN